MQKGNSGTEVLKQLERLRAMLDACINVVRVGGLAVPSGKTRLRASAVKQDGKGIDFSKPIRPFVKRYGVGMSGAEKFTLVLAYLAAGDLNKKVPLEEIHKYWDRMTARGLMGMKFNRFFSAKARENDWVSTEKSGLYHLRPCWLGWCHVQGRPKRAQASASELD